MAEANRLRCPRCGVCYEGDATASEIQTMACENCGATTKLLEEDPDGVRSGAFPPLPRLLALAGAILLCLVAVRFSFFAIFAFGVLVYLAVEVLQGHKKQRAERIALWDRLRDTYADLDQSNKRLTTDLTQTKQSLAELTARYELIAPERRDRLAEEIITQQKTLGVLCDLATMIVEKDNLHGVIKELKDEVITQQKTLGVLGDLATMIVEKDNLQRVIKELKARIVSFEEEELLQTFGFYKPLYDCADSAAYRQLLDKVRDRQKEMVKEQEALRISGVFNFENDKAADKKITKKIEKLILRAFNGECDAIIDKVTFSNLDAISARITKAYQDLNGLCQAIKISITQAYLNAKIEELHVCYEYQMKLKEEREEQRKIREQMREQARLIKEIEDAREKIEKEETHFNQVIAELQARMEASATSEREQYQVKLREYEIQLAAVQKDKEEVAYREQSTRAGYVYIISNIGAFGDNAYKIGVTRRLEPQERIDELGDSSVPFDFDVHAMIFSDDAPSLEGALHERFADRSINKVNSRKEFFRVPLEEIEEVVRTHHNKVVEFTKIAKAEEYRLTMAKEKAMAQPAGVSSN